MAQGLLQHELPSLRVFSAGIGALIGHQADEKAQKLMLERQIDISSHRAMQINKVICASSDLVLVMTDDQKRYIEATYPQTRGKVYLLCSKDVPDPYKKSHSDFRSAFEMIEFGVKTWSVRIGKFKGSK